MDKQLIQKMLVDDEGLSLYPYLCTEGYHTIGVGRNLAKKGISEREALFMLGEDINSCFTDLQLIFLDDFEKYPQDVQHSLINMRFQLGFGGFRKFKKMIFAFQCNDLREAAAQMRDSLWYTQTPKRAERLAKIIEGFA